MYSNVSAGEGSHRDCTKGFCKELKLEPVPVLCLPWLRALSHSVGHLQHFKMGRREGK